MTDAGKNNNKVEEGNKEALRGGGASFGMEEGAQKQETQNKKVE